MNNAMRRHSSMPVLLRLACDEFERIPDLAASRGLALGDSPPLEVSVAYSVRYCGAAALRLRHAGAAGTC